MRAIVQRHSSPYSLAWNGCPTLFRAGEGGGSEEEWLAPSVTFCQHKKTGSHLPINFYFLRRHFRVRCLFLLAFNTELGELVTMNTSPHSEPCFNVDQGVHTHNGACPDQDLSPCSYCCKPNALPLSSSVIP